MSEYHVTAKELAATIRRFELRVEELSSDVHDASYNVDDIENNYVYDVESTADGIVGDLDNIESDLDDLKDDLCNLATKLEECFNLEKGEDE